MRQAARDELLDAIDSMRLAECVLVELSRAAPGCYYAHVRSALGRDGRSIGTTPPAAILHAVQALGYDELGTYRDPYDPR